MPKVWAAVLLSVSLWLPQPAWAITLEQVPNPRRSYGGWVSDTADILSSSTENELNRLLTQLEQRTGAEMAVVTVPNTQGYVTPKAFTTQLFNYWGIGKAGRNNGVLFLISVGDRRVEIETGRGLATILPDSRVQQIIDEQILPRFRNRDFDGGTLAGVRQLTAVLQGQPVAEVQASTALSNAAVPRAGGTEALAVALGLLEGSLLLLGILLLGLGWRRSRLPVYLKAERGGGKVLSLTRREQGTMAVLSSLQSDPIRLLLYSGSLCLGLFLLSASGNWLVLVLPFLAVVTTDGILGSKRGIPFQPVVCQSCGRPMRPIQPQVLDKQLPPAHRLAKSQRRASYYGWFCPACQGMAVVVREGTSCRHLYCPRCQALTLDLTTQILQEATYSSSGLKLEILTCPICQYRSERTVVIPPLRDSDSERDSGSTSDSSDSSDRDFGGGSSDGGGAGGSW